MRSLQQYQLVPPEARDKTRYYGITPHPHPGRAHPSTSTAQFSPGLTSDCCELLNTQPWWRINCETLSEDCSSTEDDKYVMKKRKDKLKVYLHFLLRFYCLLA